MSNTASGSLFSSDSMIWRVDRELVLLLGGGRALLMQMAHPKVARGVAEHSSFRQDPLRRLNRTMNTMWSIVFDEPAQAEVSLKRVKEIHRAVRSGSTAKAPGDFSYDARDPELLFWVHATLVDSALVTYDRFVRPLSPEEKSRYYDETKDLARLFAIPEEAIPLSLEAFQAYLKGMMEHGAISVGPTAHLLAREILYPRPWLLRAGSPLSTFITVGLLPEPLREAYGLEWNEGREKSFRLLGGTVRGLLPLLPDLLRVVPQARAAEKEFRRVGSFFW